MPEATFMIHPVLWQSPPNQVFTAERLREVATYCDVGTWSIAKIIAATTSKEVNTVHADISQTTLIQHIRNEWPAETIRIGFSERIAFQGDPPE